MELVDFLINVHPELPLNEQISLESDVADMDGVMSAHFSPGHPHMLKVAYDPDVISSSAVLERVGKRGVAADKVGL